MRPYRNFLFIILLCISSKAFCQQDVDFHLNSYLLPGKIILKAKRDFYDPYLWVLAKNNEVYRVNSLTLTVDDYTPQFAAYNNLQFIDIAGRSQDTVFIATNSTNIIEYEKGALRVIGQTDGIPGVINSIGVDYTGSYMTDNAYGMATRPTANTLLIGTNGGICHYDYQKEIITPGSSHVPATVFEATYRNEMFSDLEFGTYNNDVVQQYPVLGLTKLLAYGGYIYYGTVGGFGNNINTAYYNHGDAYVADYESVIYSNQFWGTANGLFQNLRNYSYQSSWGYSQYLNGISVNKITSIYGLLSFGESLVKENLLIGTANGLYFSNSKYQQPHFVNNNAYSIFHYNALGNVAINDICVNATSYTQPICEDGVWVAADNGLYLIKPDYANYLNSTTLKAISFQNKPDTLSKIKVCSGDSVNAFINTYVYRGNTFQWYKDGVELQAQSKDTLVIKAAGDYYAVLYDPCGNVHLESNHLKVEVITAPVFSFNYPNKLQYCDSASTTLKTDNDPGYHYRWYTNGILNGDTTYNFTVTQSGKYKVEVSACTNSWVPSKEIEVDLINLPLPAVTANKPKYCTGDNAILSVSAPINPAYTINWYRDNVLLPANTNQASLSTNIAGSYTVAIISNQANTDGTVCSQTSAVQTILFNPPPTVSIQKIIRTTLCDGQTADLKANYNTGTVKWSTSETTDQISISRSGNYRATVTSPAGCQTEASIDVSFLPNPVLNINDAGVCIASHKTATLTAPAGMASYTWNGQPGTETYVADHPQTVTLTVTDVNGCQATQEIHITDECPDVKIPNTFTPNGDGINDTWNILGLEYDPTAVVKIFTRYGQQVYESRGYGTAWNGEDKGKKLPTGVYYYIITSKNGTLKYSGSVTIIF
jgi:gliding motility-associated-like protein